MERWFFDSRTPEETLACASTLGRSIGANGLVLALIGPLGAGKTVFVKGLAAGLGIDPRVVSSPTFVIANQYPIPVGPLVLHHLDLYRLESAAELDNIGLDDMLAGGQVLAVEWADRFPHALGSSLLKIEFEGPSPEEADSQKEGVSWRGRRAVVTAQGADAERVLADWAEHHAEESGAASAGGGETSAMRALPEMRLLLMLVLGLGLLLTSRFDGESPLERCESLRAVETDRLGTVRAVCLEGAGESPDARRLEGVGRLLDGERIDANRASAALLRVLPQLGPTRAAAIVEAREARATGRFTRIADLETVKGIGPKTLARIAAWLTLDPEIDSPSSAPNERPL